MATQTKYNERQGMNHATLRRNIEIASFVTGICMRSGTNQFWADAMLQ